MKLLKEGYDTQSNLFEYLNDTEVQHYLETYQFDKIYANKPKYQFGTADLTEVFLNADINPLLYMTEIPGNFIREKLSITSFKIPETIRKISIFAFYHCDNLTDISIPNTIEVIDARAFAQCCKLTKIDLPNSLKHIGNESFLACEGLTEVIIPNSVKIICDRAFSDCLKLKRVVVGNGVSEIRHYAFASCRNLVKVTFEENSLLDCISNNAFDGCTRLKEINLPSTLTWIGWEAFKDCIHLEKIVIPDSVESINTHAFEGCKRLKSVKIGKKVNNLVSDDIFNGCDALEEIICPQHLAYTFRKYKAILKLY